MLLCSIALFFWRFTHKSIKKFEGPGDDAILCAKQLQIALFFTQWFAIRTQYKWQRCEGKAKEWCGVYNILSAGDVSTKLRGFNTSLQNDLAAVANISDRIDRTSLAMFMNIIDECSGQIFTSGIGRSVSFPYHRRHGCIISNQIYSTQGSLVLLLRGLLPPSVRWASLQTLCMQQIGFMETLVRETFLSNGSS